MRKYVTGYEAELNRRSRSFVVSMRPDGDGKLRRVATATCGCGATHDVGMVTSVPPEILLKKFGQAGWYFASRGDATCPTCQRTPRAKPTLTVVPPTPAAVPATAPPPPPAKPTLPQPIPTETAAPQPPKEPTKMTASAAKMTAQSLPISLMRRIIGMLEERFDTTSGQYATGWSDQKIAEIAGVPRSVVTEVRDDGFGPIKADVEMQAMQAEQARIGKALEKLLDDHVAIGRRMETYAIKMGVK